MDYLVNLFSDFFGASSKDAKVPVPGVMSQGSSTLGSSATSALVYSKHLQEAIKGEELKAGDF
jgi:hypothetical protein